MKIRKVTKDIRSKVYALLSRAFSDSQYEVTLVKKLHENDKPMHEWVCIHAGKVIAYIAFTDAYQGDVVCGLHLAPMAVTPDQQKQGVGTELIQFALRQEPIRNEPLFVLGEPGFYKQFGFEPCTEPLSPFDHNNAHFLSLRNSFDQSFTIGYEPEFKTKNKNRSPRGENC